MNVKTAAPLRSNGFALDMSAKRLGRLETTDGHLRLSTDIRYQNVRDEIDARWANHWSLGDML